MRYRKSGVSIGFVLYLLIGIWLFVVGSAVIQVWNRLQNTWRTFPKCTGVRAVVMSSVVMRRSRRIAGKAAVNTNKTGREP